MDSHTAKPTVTASVAEADTPVPVDIVAEKNRFGISTLRGGAIYSVRPAAPLSFLADCHYASVFLAPGRNVKASIGGDAMEEFDVPIGALGIAPAGTEVEAIWPSSVECIDVLITPSGMMELAEQEFPGRTIKLLPTKATTVDWRALYLARLLRSELAQPATASELYVDSIVTLFGIHLLRNYSDAAFQSPPARGTLSYRNRHRIREFLSEKFATKLSVADLAGICEMSPRHFIKTFTRTFGKTPHRYLTDLRLDFAEHLLFEGKLTIAEVATFSGFSSQSHLTAALTKHRGVTPAQLLRGR